MDRKEILIVIDMQYDFLSIDNNGNEIAACMREIERAKKNNSWIFFLEYSNSGNTLSSLTKLVVNYDNYEFYEKNRDDGSSLIISAISRRKMLSCCGTKSRIKEIRICGFNRSACVADTVISLVEYLPDEISVVFIDDAIGDNAVSLKNPWKNYPLNNKQLKIKKPRKKAVGFAEA